MTVTDAARARNRGFAVCVHSVGVAWGCARGGCSSSGRVRAHPRVPDGRRRAYEVETRAHGPRPRGRLAVPVRTARAGAGRDGWTERGRGQARSAGEPAVDHHRCRSRRLHAGGVRAGRDGFLPREARGARREHELRRSSASGSSRSSSSGTRSCSAGYSYVLPGADFGYTTAIGGPLLKIGEHGSCCGRAASRSAGIGKAGGAAVLGFFLYMVAFMDTTPRSRRGRWPSGGSGRRSSAGACSAAVSTTRCSAPSRGAAAG